MQPQALFTTLSGILWAAAAVASPAFSYGRVVGGRTNGGPISLKQVQNKGYKRNGVAEYAKTLARYKNGIAGIADKATSKAAVTSPIDSTVAAVPVAYDKEYLTPVYIGSPPQKFEMDLDTGSADLWLTGPDNSLMNGSFQGPAAYHPEKSRSSVAVANSSWEVEYGDGSAAYGNVYLDTISLGNISVDRMAIEAARFNTAIDSSGMSGIIGLSFNMPSSALPKQRTFLEALGPKLVDTVFSVDIKHNATGSYHFGHIDKSAFIGPMTTRPVGANSTFWSIDLDSVYIGRTVVTPTSYRKVVLDTGSSLMMLPSALVEPYWEKVPGASFQPGVGYVFPCNTTLPSYTFKFKDGWRGSVPGCYLNYQPLKAGLCYGGLQPSFMPFGILGDTFLKAFYVVFDFNKKAPNVRLAAKRL